MRRILYLLVFSGLGASMFNDNFPDIGLRSMGKHMIAPITAQISSAHAEANKTIDSIEGPVVAVSDGDTLTVKSQYGDAVIRLFAIDAPEETCHGFSDRICTESGQPDAKESKLYLRDLTLNKNVVVKLGQGTSGKRLVGTVFKDGQDINLEMVKAGHAWHYKYFAKNQTHDDREIYTQAENNAKFLKSGLWQYSNPVQPWVYRKSLKFND